MNKVQQKQRIADALGTLHQSEVQRFVSDHRYFYHWMLEAFPNRPAAGVALHQAIREGVVKDIAQYQSLSGVIAERFARRLTEQTGLTLEWSLWAVQTWSDAVGVSANVRQRSLQAQAVRRPNRGLLSNNQAKMLEIKGHRKTLTDLAFSPNGRWLATASLDRSIRIWDARSGTMLARFLAGHRDWIRALNFHPDGSRLVSGGDDGAIRLWDLSKGKRLQRIPAHQGWVRCVAYSHDGTLLASGGQDGMVCIWATDSLEQVQRLGPFGRPVNRLSFSYDGSTVAISMSGQVDVWDLRENKRLYRRSIRGERGSVLALPDGGLLIASKEGLQRIEVNNPDATIHFVGHQGGVWGLALDPNGPTVVSFGEDRSVQFWDARSGTALWKMNMKTDINAVSISSEGRFGVALSSTKGWLWELEREQ